MKDPTSPGPQEKRRRAIGVLVLAALVIGLGDVTGSLSSRLVRVNTSPSLPLGLYRPVELPFERNRLVSACLPLSIAGFGRARVYLPPGRCPGGAAPVLKYLAAVPGDLVEVTRNGIIVNGVRLRHSGALSRDSRGRSLVAVPPGSYRLRACYWLAAPHPLSWDSRYFGCVPRASLGEVMVPWLTTSLLRLLPSFALDASSPARDRARAGAGRAPFPDLCSILALSTFPQALYA